MVQTSNPAGAAGAAPVADQPSSIRNVVLVGHSGAGKTTLLEALLVATGTVNRAGRVEDGTTVSDFDEAEQRQQRSVSLSVAPVLHAGIKVNLLDTPGYADFVGDLRAGLRGADAALFVVSAVDGVDGSTRMLWEECAAVGMPRAVVVTKLDKDRADFDEAVAICQRVFGDGVLPLYLPMHADDGSPAGLIGLLSQKIYDYSSGTRTERAPDPEHLPLIDDARSRLIEGIIAESEDETLMSLLAAAVWGDGSFMYYVQQIATMAILLLAANTAYADFPRIASILSKDGYLPRQLRNRGDRLVFSNGIVALSVVAGILIVVFGGVTTALIPLYAVGVFLSFTLSQLGMVRHQRRHQEPGWKVRATINAVGATATFIVLLIVVVSKFVIGAWVPVVLIPAIAFVLTATGRSCEEVARAHGRASLASSRCGG